MTKSCEFVRSNMIVPEMVRYVEECKTFMYQGHSVGLEFMNTRVLEFKKFMQFDDISYSRGDLLLAVLLYLYETKRDEFLQDLIAQ